MDSDLLWILSGSRCAICQRTVIRAGRPVGPDQLPGVEFALDRHGTKPTKYSDSILLCQVDAAMVAENPDGFPDSELRRLKANIERLHSRRIAESFPGDGSPQVRLLAHIAVFIGSQTPFYFLKVVNDSLVNPVQIEKIWFDVGMMLEINNPQRPLPVILGAGDTFETWMPTAEVPAQADILTRARVRLGDGSIVESTANTTYAPAGIVGGGGAPLSEIYVEQSYVHSASKWDVFISYASEDRDEVAHPLYQELSRLGLNVWFDGAALQIGDSLRRKIDEGVANSAFGVVIISPDYIRKGWTQYELDGIMSMNVNGKQRLLPIWHRITQSELLRYSPSLVDKIARSTGEYTISNIAEEIAERVLSASTSLALASRGLNDATPDIEALPGPTPGGPWSTRRSLARCGGGLIEILHCLHKLISVASVP
jgi:TIR domain